MTAATLLGPQRLLPRIAETAKLMGLDGPLASITAGWEEREGEDDELREHLPQARNLRLFERTERVFAEDPELFEAMRARHDELRTLQKLYRLRLDYAMQAARELAEGRERTEEGEVELTDAIEAVSALDTHHLGRVREVHAAFSERWKPQDRLAVVAAREAVARDLEGCAGVAIAGGHVVVLLNRLRLLGLPTLIEGLPIMAWSAGAMVLTERVVLFHDMPPQGRGHAEVLETGLGLVRGVVALPHAKRRLLLDDAVRVSLLARRFAPKLSVPLDEGCGIRWDGETWKPLLRGRRLEHDGRVTELDPVSALDTLLEQKDLAGSDIDSFLGEHSVPIVEGSRVTFVWRGEADAVQLQHFIYGLESARPFTRLASTDLWYLVMEIPARSRVEYKLIIERDGKRELVRDPLNPEQAFDPYGSNSVCAGEGYEREDWTLPDAEARAGKLTTHLLQSQVYDEPRPVTVYLPARFRRTARYPLLVVHDGSDYLRFSSLQTVLDNLIHRLEIPPVIAALVDSPNRLDEYGANERHGRFLVEDLLPAMKNNWPLVDRPSARTLMGASFGAVATLHTAWKHPGVFGNLLLQSGSFAFTDIGESKRGPLFEKVVQFVNAFRADPGRPADKLFLSCGVYESLIYENRSLVPLLNDAGLEVKYVESRDGHNWENWRDRLREGLSWLSPGPLWMVYE